MSRRKLQGSYRPKSSWTNFHNQRIRLRPAVLPKHLQDSPAHIPSKCSAVSSSKQVPSQELSVSPDRFGTIYCLNLLTSTLAKTMAVCAAPSIRAPATSHSDVPISCLVLASLQVSLALYPTRYRYSNAVKVLTCCIVSAPYALARYESARAMMQSRRGVMLLNTTQMEYRKGNR